MLAKHGAMASMAYRAARVIVAKTMRGMKKTRMAWQQSA